MLNVGDVFETNISGTLVVTSYTNAREVGIRFELTGFERVCQADNIRKGKVYDPLFPSVYGVGYQGEGEYTFATEAYSRWHSMLGRCYNPTDVRYATYGGAGVTVCSEWHNFQNYAKWFTENKIIGLHVDKDVTGEKLYSPNTCRFLTPADNNIEAHAKYWTVVSPKGESMRVFNLSAFCRDNNLDSGNMSRAMNNKSKSHKGWTKQEIEDA